jgi:hypothetical protein
MICGIHSKSDGTGSCSSIASVAMVITQDFLEVMMMTNCPLKIQFN